MPRRTRRDPNAIHWKGWYDLEWTIGGKRFIDRADNALYDVGEQDILEVYFRAATAPTGFYMGLLKSTYSIVETHTMVTVAPATNELTNASDGGYSARLALTRDNTGWPTSALNGGDWQISSAQVTWTATGAWTDTAGFLFLVAGGAATVGDTTGKLLAVAALSPTRQLQASGDTLKVTYNVKLQ
jgi:hypothetical protein